MFFNDILLYGIILCGNSIIDFLVSIPSELKLTKEFQSESGYFKLWLESSVSFNSIFNVESFIIKRIETGVSYSLNRIFSNENVGYRNFSDIHDRLVVGNTYIDISPEWNNISLIAEIVASSNNLSYISMSLPIIVDFRSLYEGI